MKIIYLHSSYIMDIKLRQYMWWKMLLLYEISKRESEKEIFFFKFPRIKKSRRLLSIADAGNVSEVGWETS